MPTMTWPTLLSGRRISHAFTPSDRPHDVRRTDFQRDADRITFSSAFRRLHDKTQVYPLPENDHVHTRLTHSIEVASVGRSLGVAVGEALQRPDPLALGATIAPRDVGDIVSTACLAHDIGNPPFGHAGEDAIGQYFRDHPTFTDALTVRERADLESFEGNAQGFRILTRLQMEADGGMKLTAATLSAFTKYPRPAGPDLRDKTDVAAKKHGFMQSEAAIFEAVATETGLIPRGDTEPRRWCRHPLTFLVEAADDISYLVLDLEDGLRLGYAPRDEAHALLAAIGSRDKTFKRPPAERSDADRVSYLRAKAISQLVQESTAAFLAHHDEILSGQHRTSITDGIPSHGVLEDIRTLTRKHCYNHRAVLEISLAGYEVLGGLLDAFVPAALAPKVTPRQRMLLDLMALPHGNPVGETYARLLRVTDYVSGMTDRYATSLYRKIKGIALPGATR